MLHFLQQHDYALFKAHHLHTFHALWQLPHDWFEPPNSSSKGWSGVSQLTLTDNEQNTHTFFIKRQENYLSRSWSAPFYGRAVIDYEVNHLLRFQRSAIPSLQVVCFASIKKNKQAILVTRALEAYHDLTHTIRYNIHNITQKKQFIQKLATIISTMHRQHLQHRCLYPKHILVKITEQDFDIRLIDLEKVRYVLLPQFAALRDLDSLYRHSSFATQTDMLRFFLAYRDTNTLRPQDKRLLRKILKKSQRKQSI